MATWKISSEIEPNYAGGLMRAKWLIGGVRTVKTLAQRNAIPALYRYFSAEESTIVFVEDESQLYRLNNNPSGVTTNADWTLISFGNVSSALTPIGTWNIDNTTPVLSDAGASGLNGNFYFVTGAPTPEEVTISGLFEGEPVTLVDGNMIISVGTRWVVVSNSTAWNSIDKPQSIIDYVAGTVISHTHTVADISDLGSYLTNYLTRSDVADPDIDFEAVPDSDIISSEFIKKYYYRKTEVDSALSSFAQSFLELTDTPSSYSGFASKLVQVNATGTALEFVDPPATDLTSVLTEGNDAGGFEIINLGLGTQPTSALRRTDILDVSGILKTSLMPASVMERVYVYAGVETLPENAGLTTTQVQNGDVVKINSTGLMYVVVDDTQLNLALGYTVFSAGSAASVPWSGVTGTPTTLAGYGITDAWKTSGTTSLAANVTIDGLGFDTYMVNQHEDLINGSQFLFSKWVINLTSTLPDGESSIDIAEDIILNTTRNFSLTSPDIKWIPARKTFTAGGTISFSGSGLTPTGGGNSIVVGEGIAISQDYSWSAIFGDVYTLDAIFNNGLMAGTGHTLSGGAIGSSTVLGSTQVLSGTGMKLHSFVTGLQNTYNVSGTSVGNSMFGTGNTLSGSSVNNAFVAGNLSTVSATAAFAFGYPIAAQTTRPIISSGVHAFNFSANSSSQTLTHGALANYSVILGGQDHHIPSDSPGTIILGGNGIKARAASSNWTYTTNFHALGSVLLSSGIADTPTTNTALDVRGLGVGGNVMRLASFANVVSLVVDNAGNLNHTGYTTSGFGATFTSLSGGDVNILNVTGTFTRSSGTYQWVGFRVNPTIDVSGTATSTVIGIDYNPTITSYTASNHTGLRISGGNIIFGGTAPTASTRFDVRGIGTTTANVLRLANANNVQVMSVIDNGKTTLGGISNEDVLTVGNDQTNKVFIGTGRGSAYAADYAFIAFGSSFASTTPSIKNNGSAFYFDQINLLNVSGTVLGNSTFELRGPRGNNAGINIALGNNRNSAGGGTNLTSGTYTWFQVPYHIGSNSDWNPSSGTATFTAVSIPTRINTTGTYAGTVFGIDYSPVLTSATGLTHYAARFTSGKVLIGGSTISSSTRLDVRGEGTGGAYIFKFSDLNNSNRLTLTDNGQLILTAGVFTSTIETLTVAATWNPSSGTGVYKAVSLAPTINTSGTYAGAAYGIDYNPTLTSTTGLTHHAARFTSGNILIGASTITADTRLDVRGLGTGTGNILRAADANNIPRLVVQDDGKVIVTGSTTGTGYGLEVKSTGVVGSIFMYMEGSQAGAIHFNQNGKLKYSQTTGVSTTGAIRIENINTFSNTVNTAAELGIGSAFAPTSGTGKYTGLLLNPVYNQTLTASGDIIGIDYNPTSTSVLGNHYAALFRSGRVGIGLAVPLAPLHIQTTTNDSLRISTTSTNSVGIKLISGNGGAPRTLQLFGGNNDNCYVAVESVQGITFKNARFGLTGTDYASFSPSARLHVKGTGTTTGELFRLDNITPTNTLLVLDDGTGTVNGTWTWATGQVGIGATPIADTKLYVKGASSTSLDYAAILENAIGEAIAKFRNDLSFEMGGTSAILEVNDGIESGNAAIRFLTFSTGSGLGFRFQDKSFNDYLNFRSLLTDRAAVFRQPVEYDYNQGEKRVTKQYTITTDTVAAAQTVIFEFTLADADHYDIKVLHAEATATDSTSITSLGVDCADVRKIAATNIEGNTAVATQSRLPSGVVSGTFNWNLDTTNQKIQYRFQNLTGTGKEFVIWCDISYVKRITPITS